jgi:hypothetical protein
MSKVLGLQALESAASARVDSLPFSTASWLCPPFTVGMHI